MKLITKAKPNTRIIVLSVLAILAIVIIFLVIPLTRKAKPVVTDTGKFTITQTGDRTEEVILEIEDQLPIGRAPEINAYESDGVYRLTKVASEGSKTTYKITPVKAGVSMLDFVYETAPGQLYQKLHYTLEVLADGNIRMYTVYTSEPER